MNIIDCANLSFQMLEKAPFQSQTELILSLLKEVNCNPNITQRSLAKKLGIALGVVNALIKHCLKKGIIKIQQTPPKRYAYYLTSEGFHEKSILVRQYIENSLKFYRLFVQEFEDLARLCIKQGWERILFLGKGELADIASLVFKNYSLTFYCIDSLSEFRDCEAIIITDRIESNKTYKECLGFLRGNNKNIAILAIPSLCINFNEEEKK